MKRARRFLHACARTLVTHTICASSADRVETFLEVFGNTKLRDKTAAYLTDRSKLLADIVLGDGHKSGAGTPQEFSRFAPSPRRAAAATCSDSLRGMRTLLINRMRRIPLCDAGCLFSNSKSAVLQAVCPL